MTNKTEQWSLEWLDAKSCVKKKKILDAGTNAEAEAQLEKAVMLLKGAESVRLYYPGGGSQQRWGRLL